jgi:hypothetical protein
MTLDASGNLIVGGTAATNTAAGRGNITINGSSSSILSIGTGGTERGYVYTQGTDFIINASTGALNLQTAGASAMTFVTNNTERARITSGGTLLLNRSSQIGSELLGVEFTGNNTGVYSYNESANSTGIGFFANFTSATGTNTNTLLIYRGRTGGVDRFIVYGNGGIANYQSNNVDLSDERTKKEITPAASMWDKIGALEIVTYKYNDQTHDDVNLGVIAQQVEAVEPVWVDTDGFGETPEDGVPLKTVYTKDITFAAIKALQEAMARIEQLEAKVAALESK